MASATQVNPRPSPKAAAKDVSRSFKIRHKHGQSELHRAAFQGNSEVLHQLLDQIDADPCKSVTINKRNRLGCAPIRLAATGGHLKCLSYLIQAGAKVDTSDFKGQTPLFVAVKKRQLECARVLLQAGACPDGDPGSTLTPLYVAIMNNDISIVLLLLEYGAHPDKLYHKTRNCPDTFNHRLSSLDAAFSYICNTEDSYRVIKALLNSGSHIQKFTCHSHYSHHKELVVKLLHEFGIEVIVHDVNSWLDVPTEKDSIRHVLQTLKGTPRRLMSACRLVIISSLPKPRRGCAVLENLPLPPSLIDYLKFCEE